MSDWDNYSSVTKALLDRFITGNSISISGESYDNKSVGKGANKQNAICYSIPNSKLTKLIRESWTDNRRAMPREGIVFPDGSILTVLFEAKGLPFEKLLTPVIHHIAISDRNNEMMGFVEKYSYCFYPNSRLADSIGYFRYDFHVDNMGDGDLGEHTYFHFHRNLEESFRHATGPILDYGEIVSGLEKVLAKKEREVRLKNTFERGDFEALLMDLTIEGVEKLCESLYPGSSYKKFKHKNDYEQFLETLIS